MKNIGALHQQARELGLTILSQQGILHDYETETYSVFLVVEDPSGTAPVRSLPEDSYTCIVLRESDLKHVPALLQEKKIQPKLSLYLNTDIYDYCLTHHLHWMEVQSLVTHPINI